MPARGPAPLGRSHEQGPFQSPAAGLSVAGAEEAVQSTDTPVQPADTRTAELESGRAVVRAQVGAVGASFLRARPWLVAGPAVGSSLAVASTGGPPLRTALLATLQVSMLSFFAWEAVGLSREGAGFVSTRRLGWSLAITLTGLGVACGLTGADHSPLLPMLLAPTGIAFAGFGARPGGLRFFGYLGAWLAILVAWGQIDPWPPLASEARVVIGLLAVALAAALLWVGVAALTSAHAAAVRDVDRLRTVAMQEAASRARDLEAIGAKVAHELRNPLTAVRALTQLSQREAANGVPVADGSAGPGPRYTVILEQLDRMTSTLDAYLAYARPPQVLAWRPTDPTAVAGGVAAVLEGRARAAGVSLTVQAAPGTAVIDPDRMHDALLNLVTNALDATPRGGAVVLTATFRGDDLVFRVDDAGPGMDESTLARVGTPYFTTRDGGTGLGVMLARSVARQHGGDLKYESRPGRGTTAVLTVRSRPGAQR